MADQILIYLDLSSVYTSVQLIAPTGGLHGENA
jgi:hypothetical protein